VDQETLGPISDTFRQ